ncbi:MAG: hypothetical protein RL300_1574 [Pseudomonadota bacterium]|jgi:branched-chain amino acid transport system permease protein
MRHQYKLAFFVLFAVLAIAPLVVYPIFVINLLCFAIFAIAFNLLFGQTGLLAFGHALFFGGAAYVTGYALKVWAWPPEAAILLGVGFAAVTGLFVGVLAIQRQGLFFSMITLALAQMFYFICVAAPFTGGDDGLSSVPRGYLLGTFDLMDDKVLYYFVFIVFAAVLLFVYRVMFSPYGQVLRAIRDNEARATSLGYAVQRYKLLVFVQSAALAGLAGALKVLVFRIATLVDVHWSTSGDVVLMTLVGGISTVFGPLLGAAFIQTMQFQLQAYSQWLPVVQGVVFMVMVLLLPKGVAGEFAARVKWPGKAKNN